MSALIKVSVKRNHAGSLLMDLVLLCLDELDSACAFTDLIEQFLGVFFHDFLTRVDLGRCF